MHKASAHNFQSVIRCSAFLDNLYIHMNTCTYVLRKYTMYICIHMVSDSAEVLKLVIGLKSILIILRP